MKNKRKTNKGIRVLNERISLLDEIDIELFRKQMKYYIIFVYSIPLFLILDLFTIIIILLCYFFAFVYFIELQNRKTKDKKIQQMDEEMMEKTLKQFLKEENGNKKKKEGMDNGIKR